MIRKIIIALFPKKEATAEAEPQAKHKNPVSIKSLKEVSSNNLPSGIVEERKFVFVKVRWNGEEDLFLRVAKTPFLNKKSQRGERHHEVVLRLEKELESFGLYYEDYTITILDAGRRHSEPHGCKHGILPCSRTEEDD